MSVWIALEFAAPHTRKATRQHKLDSAPFMTIIMAYLMSVRHAQPACTICCLALLLLSSLSCVRGQGLRNSVDMLKASVTYTNMKAVYRDSQAMRNAWRASLATRSSACSTRSTSLCATSTSLAADQTLRVAASPQRFDARTSQGDYNPVGPVKDQGSCATCAAFTVLAVAHTAAAVALRKTLTGSMSEQQFYFCSKPAGDIQRSCSSGMNMREAVTEFNLLSGESKYPVLDTCLPYDSFGGGCQASCQDTVDGLINGKFRAKQLGSIPEMQQHIRQHGSIACRIQLHSDIRPFYEKQPKGIYPGPGRGATVTEAHAVQVIGYNNDQQYWLAKNSWGKEFADGGLFRVAFNSSVICFEEETYGFIFDLQIPSDAALGPLTTHPTRSGCWQYVSRPGDYPDKLSTTYSVPLQKILLDNLDVLPSPDQIPAGTKLTLCNVPPRVSSAAKRVGASSASSGALSEMQALLAIGNIMDKGKDGPLKGWVYAPEAGPTQYCFWWGVKCNSRNQVEQLDLSQPEKDGLRLTGRLPPGYLLRDLPALRIFYAANNSLAGTLPEDYADLPLVQLGLGQNKLEGTLPASWARTNMTYLWLWSNRMSGPLPSAWGNGMKRMKVLWVSNNDFSGTLPPSWGSMPAMERLFVHQNVIQGTIPDTWTRFPALQELAVYKMDRLTGTLPAAFSRLRQLQKLQMQDCGFTGTLPAAWSALTKLEHLYLTNNRLNGTLPAAWASMASLKDIRMEKNYLTGTLPEAYSNLTRLETAWFADNKLRGTLPASYGRSWIRLNWGLFDSNNFTGTIPEQWGALPAAKVLGFTGNKDLRGCLPAGWKGRLTKDQKLTGLFVDTKGTSVLDEFC